METFAYRFSDEPEFVRAFREDGKPPNPRPESCFLGKDDELVDVTDWFRIRMLPLKDGWVVWNKTRKWLVIRGSLHEQLIATRLAGFLRQSIWLETRVEWHFGLHRWPELGDGNRPADAALTLRCRDGRKVSANLEVEKRVFGCEIEPYVGDLDGSEFSLRISPNWRGADGTEWLVWTTTEGRLNSRFAVAGCRVPGRKESWVVAVEIGKTLADGSPWKAARQRETPMGPEPMRVPELKSGEVVHFPDGWSAGVWRIRPEALEALIGNEWEDNGHPGNPETGPVLLPDIQIPRRLSRWFSGTGIDATRAMEHGRGIPLGKDDRIVCDFSGHWMAAMTKDPDTIDLITMFLIGGCEGRVTILRTETRVEEFGKSGARELVRCFLRGQAGQRATMIWFRPGAEDSLLDWSAEPLVNEDGLFDVWSACRLDFPWRQSLSGPWSTYGQSILPEGRPVLQSSVRSPAGKGIRQWLETKAVPVSEADAP